MILFTFTVIFLQIKIFSIKIVFQIYISCRKMNQLCVPNRLKAIKKTRSGLIGMFTIKKKEFCLRALVLETFSVFICFFLKKIPRDQSFHIEVLLTKNLIYG